MLTGINYHRICSIAFGLSSSLAVIAGTFFALSHQINPSLGLSFTFKGWVAVILGGMGSLGGVIIAGLLLGVIESLTAYLWIPALKEAVLFGVLLLVLVLKPEGILSFSDHHMKKEKILSEITGGGLFRLKKENRKTCSFEKV